MSNLLSRVWNALPLIIRQGLKRSQVFRILHGVVDSEYEPQVSKFIHRIVQPGWVCADVGANIGKITRLMAFSVGSQGRIFAFEPHPDNFKQISQEIKILGLADRVMAENMAVSDGCQDHVTLFIGRANNGGHEFNIVGHDIDGNPTAELFEVTAVSLDNYFASRPKPNFIKIDVEGAGGQVLAGMRHLLADARPLVLMEMHDSDEWAGRKHLYEAGYNLFHLDGKIINSDYRLSGVFHYYAVPQEINAG